MTWCSVKGFCWQHKPHKYSSVCEHQQNRRLKYHCSGYDLVMECKEFSTVNASGFEVFFSSAELWVRCQWDISIHVKECFPEDIFPIFAALMLFIFSFSAINNCRSIPSRVCRNCFVCVLFLYYLLVGTKTLLFLCVPVKIRLWKILSQGAKSAVFFCWLICTRTTVFITGSWSENESFGSWMLRICSLFIYLPIFNT